MCCELSGGHFAEDRRTFCRKKADILPNMGGHFVEWWTFCRSPRARVRSFRSPASPTRGLAVLQPGEEGRQRRSQARRSGQRVPHRGHPAAFSCPAGGRPARGGRNGVNTARKGFFWRLEPGWGRSVESRRIRQGVPQGSPWGRVRQGQAKRKDERRFREGSEKRKLPGDGSRRFRRCQGRCREIPGRFRERRRGAFPPGRQDVTAGCQDGMPRAGRNQESAL